MFLKGGELADGDDDFIVLLRVADAEGVGESREGGKDVLDTMKLNANFCKLDGLEFKIAMTAVDIADTVEGLEGGEWEVNVGGNGLTGGGAGHLGEP